jgi:hypothetical protein
MRGRIAAFLHRERVNPYHLHTPQRGAWFSGYDMVETLIATIGEVIYRPEEEIIEILDLVQMKVKESGGTE